MTVVFFNHQQQRCGVYQMGRRIGHTLRDAGVVHYVEETNIANATATVNATKPSAIIYNWHPSTIPWAPELVRRLPAVKHIALMHEISPENPWANSDSFPYRMVCDPSFVVDDKTIFKSVRHVPRFNPGSREGQPLTIGSFGFAVGGKMFPTIVHASGMEFPNVLVRLHLPAAHYGDDRGDLARQMAHGSRAVQMAGEVQVRTEIHHGFFEELQLIEWLAGNDLNVFFYGYNPGRGVASALDYAIAAQRPIAINESQMFRHVRERFDVYPKKSLRESLETSGEVVNDLYTSWSLDRLVQDYRHMFQQLGVS